MKQLESFSVQPCAFDGHDVAAKGCIHVEAHSPLHAGELVLGKQLAVNGSLQNACARVWKLSDDYAPVSVLLYAAA